MSIRPALAADLPAILAIYNAVIATSTAVYTETPATLADRQAWFAARTEQDYPVLVADEGGEAVGYASFGDFRAWPGYRHTVEHSVHIRADRQGGGLGKELVSALFPYAAKLDKHVMIAGIDAANEASLRMHERLGFSQAGRFNEVGRKFDRWLDLVFLQRFL
ncbi:GNAT family N-acetyltransferase [Bosea vaviloviae]|uniref:GNAT family N-acetyltransferase n=1 Tax=Bosea vaviloviae TaxID=1526658 RepID=A0A1D7U8E4_9HYPH|nr:GNAT family N-acetyltransferase [Bosea vaviloviae]AOO83652.1 GNAT family N-acetyltransferase [Bosea vaviloviae]